MQGITPESVSTDGRPTGVKELFEDQGVWCEWRSVRLQATEIVPTSIAAIESAEDEAQDAQTPYFSWRHGDDPYEFTAIGRLLEWEISPENFGHDDPKSEFPLCTYNHHGSPLLRVKGPLKNLFTTLRTILPESIQGIPIGYAAFPFETDRGFRRDGPWAPWPNQMICIPQKVLVWNSVDQRGVEISLSLLMDDDLFENEPKPGPPQPMDATPDSGTEKQETEKEWSKRVQSATRDFNGTQLEKVVLARSTERWAPAHVDFNALASHRMLIETYPQHINFLLQRGGMTFMGSTPETLVNVEARTLKTHALAGTVQRADDGSLAANPHPLRDEKLRREHALVVNDILSRLKPWAENIEHPQEPQLKTLPRMVHLETPISATLHSGLSILELVPELHPTPALGGFPRAEAASWLRNNEDMDRGYFGGVIGWFDAQGNGHCAVAIRCGLVTKRWAKAFAGAGIVSGSEPESEWAETALKMRPFLDHLVESAKGNTDVG